MVKRLVGLAGLRPRPIRSANAPPALERCASCRAVELRSHSAAPDHWSGWRDCGPAPRLALRNAPPALYLCALRLAVELRSNPASPTNGGWSGWRELRAAPRPALPSAPPAKDKAHRGAS